MRNIETNPGARFAVLLTAMLVAVNCSCANIAVPPPYNETSRGRELEVGDPVKLVTVEGYEIVGKVEEFGENGIKIEGQWYARKDIDNMWIRREGVAREIAMTAFFFAFSVSALLLIAKSRDDDTLKPRPPN
ncbi:MAG: hypothetical protein GTO29_11985 [Candidatus Latescibacteria bacterium]|nr:hypothetical protein [Candidatus Latescibacterota bacterium]NIO56884.1 hypothetical protein [Candidatus Latescibacterota bacterium]